MARSVRDQMVDSAVILLAKHGLDGTSFTEVLTASGAPRGSIYHHFPGGKDELIAAAIEVAGARAVALLSSSPRPDHGTFRRAGAEPVVTPIVPWSLAPWPVQPEPGTGTGTDIG